VEAVIGWALAAFVLVVLFLVLLAIFVLWTLALAKALLYLYVLYKGLRSKRRGYG
jgi:hypothetical protein